jgi:lysophospholipase L1-like esterase
MPALSSVRYLLRLPLILISFPLLAIEGKRILRTMRKYSEATTPEGITPNIKAPPLRVLLIGESTMAGVGVPRHQDGFPGAFASELSTQYSHPVHWRVYARSGYTTRRMREKLIPKIQEESSDLIVIGLGANDAFQLKSPWTFYREVKKLTQDLHHRFPGTIIVYINMPPIRLFPAFSPLLKWIVGTQIDDLRRTLIHFASQVPNVYFYSRKITAEDWKNRLNLQATPEELFSDGIHPSELAYQVWGKDVARQIFQEKWLSFEKDFPPPQK